MNSYQVIWLWRAWKRLHRIANHSANPNAIVTARAEIEQALGTDPHRYGKPLSEGLWKYESPLLRVFFSIESPRRRVLIHHVEESPDS